MERCMQFLTVAIEIFFHCIPKIFIFKRTGFSRFFTSKCTLLNYGDDLFSSKIKHCKLKKFSSKFMFKPKHEKNR